MMENGRWEKSYNTYGSDGKIHRSERWMDGLDRDEGLQMEIIGITYMMNRDICNQHSIIGREMEVEKNGRDSL